MISTCAEIIDGVSATRDVVQWPPNIGPNTTVETGDTIAQVHYCDKVHEKYVFCDNDPNTGPARKLICEEKGGNTGITGSVIETFNLDNMCEQGVCYLFSGTGDMGTIRGALALMEAHPGQFEQLLITPFSQQFLRLAILHPTTFDVSIGNAFTHPIDFEPAFVKAQFGFGPADDEQTLCYGLGPAGRIEALLARLTAYYNRLVSDPDQTHANVPTANHLYPPVGDGFEANVLISELRGDHSETGIVLGDNVKVGGSDPAMPPVFTPAGDACTVFVVKGDNVSLTDLKFDMTACTNAAPT